jgi:hypothetical protein
VDIVVDIRYGTDFRTDIVQPAVSSPRQPNHRLQLAWKRRCTALVHSSHGISAKPWHRASDAADDVESNVLVRILPARPYTISAAHSCESADECVVGDIARPAPLAGPWVPSEPCACNAVFNVMNEMVQTGGPFTARLGRGGGANRAGQVDDGNQQRSACMFCRPALIMNNSPAVMAGGVRGLTASNAIANCALSADAFVDT